MATSTQLWRWSMARGARMASTLQETMVDRRELHRSYFHPAGPGEGDLAPPRRLACYFRDFELVARVSFGTSGVLHKPLEDDAIVAEAAGIVRLVDGGGVVTLADDGDRVNPVSLAGYRRFLEMVAAERTVRPANLENSDRDAAELVHLPSFSIAGIREFWLADLDSLHYARILEEIYRAGVPAEFEEELLALQDVFFLFWKTVPRKHAYLDRLLALWRRIYDIDGSPESSRVGSRHK